MFEFRKAVAADTGELMTLINSAYRGEESKLGWTTEAELLDGWRTTEAELKTLIDSEISQILLCHDKGELAGSVHLQLVSDAAFLGMLAVRPRLQATGVGKALIAAAERAVVRDWYATKMLMDVISIRHELIAFYERRGYRLTGASKSFPVNPELWTPKVADMKLARMEKSLLLG
jgi:ribosomal protein S18 acetylase RimI-like enzyme